MKLVLPMVAILASFLLAGCAVAAPAPSQSPPSKFTVKAGSSAAAIASHVKACKDVEAESVGRGGPALLSMATCKVLGHTMVFYSWDSPLSADPTGLLKSNGEEIYYGWGDSWTAFIGDDPTLQLQFTNDGGELLRRQLDGLSPASVDVAGSMDVAQAVVKSVTGKVVHFQP